jgi:hypothetical protein
MRIKHASASLDRGSENISILSVIIAKLELGNIERHIFPAQLVECAAYAALEHRPEAFDGLSMDYADNILPFGTTGPRADQASIASSIRNSGAEAPAVRPMVLAPRNTPGSSAGIWPRCRFRATGSKSSRSWRRPGRSPRSISLVAHTAPLGY